jgi:hypothetical protein
MPLDSRAEFFLPAKELRQAAATPFIAMQS